uniref:Uncharacterized protein n=1 Tax=Tetranychus urticae TaxID=32264 RepID=T1JPN9_TETUR
MLLKEDMMMMIKIGRISIDILSAIALIINNNNHDNHHHQRLHYNLYHHHAMCDLSNPSTLKHTPITINI